MNCNKTMLWITALCCTSATADGNWSRLRLTYDKPAAESTDGLPVGKGSVGATVFGGANEDRIQFNHDTLWAGKPRSYSRAGAVEYLQQVRRLLFDGKQKETEQLAAAQFMSRPLRQAPYQPFGRHAYVMSTIAHNFDWLKRGRCARRRGQASLVGNIVANAKGV